MPLTALTLDRRYYPPLAMALFRDWAAMSQADAGFESDALKSYAGAYYEYWSDGIFRDLLTLKYRSWKDLVTYLRNATTVCLSVENRKRFLAESPEDARKAYEACERRYGRLP